MPSASEPALPWGELEDELRSSPPEQWLQLGPQASLNARHQRQILIARFAAAPELRRALAHADGPTGAWRAEAGRAVPGLPEQVSPCRRHSLTAKNLRLDLHAGGAPGRRPFVLGLTGDWGLLMNPAAYVSETLQRCGVDLLVVRRRWRGGYFRGGAGDWLRQVQAGMATLCGRRQRPVAVLGTSAGGLAALVLAERLGAPRGVAIGASADAGLFASGGPVRRLRRWHRLGSWRGRPSLLVLHAADNDRDRATADMITACYRGQRLAPARLERRAVAGSSEHNLVQSLVEQGQPLPELLPAWLALR
jgi:hypothetical protein